MFTTYARLLTLFSVSFAAIFIFFYFHGAVASLVGKAAHGLGYINGERQIMASTENYIVGVANSGYDGADIPEPALPDISEYTIDRIVARAPAYAPGRIFIRDMAGLPGMREFIKKDGRVQRLRLNQETVDPQAIVIQEGSYDFAHLYEAAQAQAPDQAIIRQGDNVYLLRMPILVGQHAALVISDKDVSQLRISQGDAAFIANGGDLFILKTKVTGWNDRQAQPARFIDKTIYRPFITSWSGSHLYIAGSEISSLGYRKGKSYGLTYSSCPDCLVSQPDLPRPTGALVGSTFTDMYYGFYSYEADNVAIVGNTYANNAVYGIDPHDRSRVLIIANNEIYGSHKKHGIIISRDVDNSWIFGNYSHNNHGSGIMLDRNCRNNIVANNVAAYNEGDGMTFFESADNRTYGNQIYRNNLSGVRIRNSENIDMAEDQVTDNARAPFVVYSMDLKKSQPNRDLKQDPYQQVASARVMNSVVKPQDRKQVFKLDGANKVALSGIHVVSAARTFGDDVPANRTLDENSQDMQKVVEVNASQR